MIAVSLKNQEEEYVENSEWRGLINTGKHGIVRASQFGV